MSELRAGISVVDITPDRPQWLDGYGSRSAPAEGAYQALRAGALALEHDGSRALLVTAEVLGFDAARVPALKARIAARTGVPEAAVILAATHTHCAPRVCDMVMPGAIDPAYVAWFEARCEEAAAAAADGMTDAALAFSRGRDEHLGINRRMCTPDGVIMRPNPAGPRDADVDTLWFEQAGRTVASVTTAACHPTSRGGQRMGGDYPGFLVRAVEEATGAPALFLLGCAGDVRPHFATPEGRFRMAELPEVEAAGRRMAETVLAAPRTPCDVTGLEVRRCVAEIPLAEPPSRERLEAVAAEDPAPLRRFWARRQLDRGELPRSVPFEIQTLHLFPCVTVVFWPGEVVSEYALWVKARIQQAGEARVIAAAYANGTVGYVPSSTLYPQGGYEVNGSHPYYNLPAEYAPDVETRLRAATLALLEDES